VTPTAGYAASGEVRVEELPQLYRLLRREIDLHLAAIQAHDHSLIGSAAVQVRLKRMDDPLRHRCSTRR